MRFLPASDRALLLELDDLAQTMVVYRHISAQQLPGIDDLVPAARTLLIHFNPYQIQAQPLIEQLRALALQAMHLEPGTDAMPGRLVEIPVHYHGEDLPEVAELLGISVAEVIARHTAQPYDAAFAGFAPGFVYLSGGANFQVPRRRSPRTKVPAGSVALGGNFSAVYPSASPGGWQLIGVTEVAMWDLHRAAPAYIQPGFRVQFVDAARSAMQVPVPANYELPSHPYSPQPQSQSPQQLPDQPLPSMLLSHAAIEIMEPGLQTLVQDAGRHGMAGLGISSSGALDLPAMHAANRTVGNPIHAAVLENVLGQMRLRSRGATTLAVTGAPVPMTLHSAAGAVWAVDTHAPIALNDGDVLQLHSPTAGVRSYIAVRGGWQVEPVLGSCSTDTLAMIGPLAVHAGQCIAVGGAMTPGQLRPVELGGGTAMQLPRAGAVVVLDVVLGPRTDWFSERGLQTLVSQRWRVTPQSNRVGIRVEGEMPLERSCHGELPSEGTVAGAIQVPMNGQPVLFLADHPLTGGYPVIASIASYHLPLAAQIPVGCQIQFRVVAPFFEQLSRS